MKNRKTSFDSLVHQKIVQDNLLLHEVVGQGDDQRLLDLMPLVKQRLFDINAPDRDWCDRRPLHIACSTGNFECCEILLENGADPSSHTSSGATPAHFAAERGVINILQLLFKYGANLHAEDHSKETPIQMAEKYCHHACVEFLHAVKKFDEENII